MMRLQTSLTSPSVHYPVCLLAIVGLLGLGCGAPDSVLGGDGGSGDNGDGDGGGNGNGNGDGGGQSAAACKKIDLVFSVDPSGSMSEELGAMSGDVFPAFATALRDIGGGLEDYRVAVIDGCPDPANFHIGGANQADCGFSSGEVWMDSSSSALETEFSCVGDIQKLNSCDVDNEDEQPIAAAIASLTAPYSTGDNAGFLRDDALLVIVTITDEDECAAYPGCDDTSDAKAQDIYNQMVAIKGDVKRMVYLGIGGGPGGCSNPPGVYGQAKPAVLTNKISSLFVDQDRGVTWDLCDGQLEAGLTEAIQVIEQACNDFPEID